MHSEQTPAAEAAGSAIDLANPKLYANRELSWLEFNQRVLDQALQHDHPLLERIKFLAIVGSNLDEFVMKRVGGLRRQVEAGVLARSGDGRTPTEQLDAVRRLIVELQTEQADCFASQIIPALAAAGGGGLRRVAERGVAHRRRHAPPRVRLRSRR